MKARLPALSPAHALVLDESALRTQMDGMLHLYCINKLRIESDVAFVIYQRVSFCRELSSSLFPLLIRLGTAKRKPQDSQE